MLIIFNFQGKTAEPQSVTLTAISSHCVNLVWMAAEDTGGPIVNYQVGNSAKNGCDHYFVTLQ